MVCAILSALWYILRYLISISALLPSFSISLSIVLSIKSVRITENILHGFLKSNIQSCLFRTHNSQSLINDGKWYYPYCGIILAQSVPRSLDKRRGNEWNYKYCFLVALHCIAFVFQNLLIRGIDLWLFSPLKVNHLYNSTTDNWYF